MDDFWSIVLLTVAIFLLAGSCIEKETAQTTCRKRGGEPVYVNYKGVVCFAPGALR